MSADAPVADGTAPSCTCRTCVEACRTNPGWPTVAEALAALDLGLASRLMLDWWNGENDERPERIEILCPATRGQEGTDALDMPEDPWSRVGWVKGRCTFLAANRCEIFGSAARPLECRAYHHYEREPDLFRRHTRVALMWDTPEGREAVARWKSEVRYA